MNPGTDGTWGLALITLGFDGFGALIVILGIIGALVAGYFAWKAEQERRERLRAWAEANGWKLDKHKRNGTSYPFPIFSTGHSRYSQYHAVKAFAGVIDGIDEPAVFDVFQYHYAITTSNGKSSSTTHYYFNCIAVGTGVGMGMVDIRDENLGDKLAAKFGRRDINFEDPDFSAKFFVSAPDRKDAFDLIQHALMRYMVPHAGQGLCIFTRGPLLFVYQSGRADVERYDRLVRFAGGLLGQIPRTLVNAERARRGLAPVLEAGAASTRARHARTGTPMDRVPEPAGPGAQHGAADPSSSAVPGSAPPGGPPRPVRNSDPDGTARLF